MPEKSFVTFRPSGPLSGTVRAPGDKSIGHRALTLGAMAVGESRISGLDRNLDLEATAAALRAMGADITSESTNWTVHGVGVGGLLAPRRVLDLGNSGTGARLLMGLVASHDMEAIFTGDGSLRQRPMDRVAEPLGRMGAEFSSGARLPLTVRGLAPAIPFTYRLPLPSAQVKSAILFAALNAPGTTRVIEPMPCRDHTARLLGRFGAAIEIGEDDGARVIELTGENDLAAQTIDVPGDPSSAAYPIIAALIVPGSEVLIENVGINPTRTGLFEILAEMGADIAFENKRTCGGEPVADIRSRHSALHAVDVPPGMAPRMIDEYPALFIAAALAQGTTTAHGLGELRVKESDRLATMANALRRLGVTLKEQEDGLAIVGSDGAPIGPDVPPRCATGGDHRIAMSLAIAGLGSRGGIVVDDMIPVATSFPGFASALAALGVES